MTKYKKTVDFIKDLYGGEDFIPLAVPVFIGNEKKYLDDCIDTTFVSSVGQYVMYRSLTLPLPLRRQQASSPAHFARNAKNVTAGTVPRCHTLRLTGSGCATPAAT